MPYDKLVLAVGSRARELSIPGAQLDGVCYLRSLDDADRIRSAARKGCRAVIIGDGYVGLETAASLRSLGMEVTILEALERVLQRVTSEPVSKFFTRIHRDEGVQVRQKVQVTSILGDSSVTGVQIDSGEVIDARLVVVGIGVVLNTKLAERIGLAVSNGIEVDSQARTSVPDIYAAGDCTCFVHPRFGPTRLESVQNANDQALVAARSLCGEQVEYDAVPWFWSEQYDVKRQIAGLAQDADDIVVRGDPDSDRCMSILYTKGKKLLAVDAINSPRDFVMGKKLIADRSPIDLAKVIDKDIALNKAVE